MVPKLFSVLKIRNVSFKNRIFVSPMCQYSAIDGVPQTWHLVHLSTRAVGGAALVMAEATAVSPEGRISPGDTGLWNDGQVNAFSPITAFISEQGSVPGIQLAHAGRKASTAVPWSGGGPLKDQDGAWTPLAPSALPFAPGYAVPKEMTAADIEKVVSDFTAAAHNAFRAGFKVIELHMAHGYLLHEFLSPISNKRTDDYGGSLANRMRLPLKVTAAVRAAWPADLPLFVRISATDWVEGGWDLPQSVEFSRELSKLGVDLIDCSSGGSVPRADIPVGPGYQVPFAAEIRRAAKIKTGAVGMITEPAQAEAILVEEKADAVFLARELLRSPYWPLKAAGELGYDISWPKQYERAKR